MSGGARGAPRVLPTRAEIARAPSRLLKRGRGAKPDVLAVAIAGETLVVKDYAPRAAWVRRLVAPRVLAREERVHRALAPHAAVPACLGRVDALALAFEYRPGEPLSRALAQRLGADASARLLERLADAVARMHALGVVHLDLRHRDNVLCDSDGCPVLVDFAFAMCFRPGSFWYRWYRPTVLVYDEYAIAKWRDRLREGAPPRRRSAFGRWRSRRRRDRGR
ncbi:MAG: hypothetical protein R3E88_20345 [Myxococcota bacterium]